MSGMPLKLKQYENPETIVNKHFRDYDLSGFRMMYLPESMSSFTDKECKDDKQFIEDDNRGAVFSKPALTIRNTDFYLSVKGVGSMMSPFSHQLMDLGEIEVLTGIRGLADSFIRQNSAPPRFITGELWLRGSPYGGQGLQHATTSLKVSEFADMTSINGFRFAPLIMISLLPPELESIIKKIYWYRKFPGRIVQEVRLIPSNVRIYFHSGSTIGGNVSAIFDKFGIDSDEKAFEFLRNFVKSGIAYLTLFTRTLRWNGNGTYSGYDFYDVWLDKDAVLAPDGTIYFVDLEGLEWITLKENEIAEKIDDQIYRSLYEFMFAYEQIEREREKRFRNKTNRKIEFEQIVKDALVDDKIVGPEVIGQTLFLEIGNILGEQRLISKFPILDW